MQHQGFTKNSGQALVMLLVFVAAGVMITMAAVSLALVNYQLAAKQAQSEYAYFLAESGAENALIRLLRDSSYLGETMSFDGGTITATISGSLPNKTILSEGVNGTLRRKVRVDVNVSDAMSVVSWREEL